MYSVLMAHLNVSSAAQCAIGAHEMQPTVGDNLAYGERWLAMRCSYGFTATVTEGMVGRLWGTRNAVRKQKPPGGRSLAHFPNRIWI